VYLLNGFDGKMKTIVWRRVHASLRKVLR
jgi:hypothetical protein